MKPTPRRGVPRRALAAVTALTSLAALAGAVQLVLGVLTPPVDDLAPLGLHSWVLPGLWLSATVAVPCGTAAVLAHRGSRLAGPAGLAASGLLLLELGVQVPFVGTDPLQAVLGGVAVVIALLAVAVRRERTGTPEVTPR